MIQRMHYDDQTLRSLLTDSDQPGCDEVAAHVESCELCQQQLEQLAEQDVSLEAVGKLLRDDSVDDQLGSHADPLSGDAQAAALSFLETSDQEDSLGKFGRYEVMEVLGRGGMGVVMRGFDPALNRQSAIKVLAPEYSGSAAARKRFSREAKSAAAVVHPHVVPIQTVEEHNGLPYLVMPVVEGRSLEARVRETGPLETIEVVRIAAQTAEGLAGAHAQGLVHRDVKPGNVLLENGVERVQLTDFGLARAADDASMTRSGIIAGTPQYMSPEQAHGDPVDHRSDLFSLGGVIYFMCTGRSPFRAETTMGVLKRIVDDQPRPLREINPDVPQWLCDIVDRLLAKRVEDRFQSAGEVSHLLNQWLVHLQAPETTEAPAVQHEPVKETSAGAGDGARDGQNRFWRFFAELAALPLFLGLAAVVWLETGRGNLRIETNSEAPVTISIHKGEKTVDELTLSAPGETVRLYAGNYVLKIEGQVDKFQLVNDEVTLSRGGQWVAKVREVKRDAAKKAVEVAVENPRPETVVGQLALDFFDALQNDRPKEAAAMISDDGDDQMKRQLQSGVRTPLDLEDVPFKIAEVVINGDHALASFRPVALTVGEKSKMLAPGMILRREQSRWAIHTVDFISPESAQAELARWKSGQAQPEKQSDALVEATIDQAADLASVPATPPPLSEPEPLYAGEPLSTWQQRFEAETNPVAKIEAATALVALSDRQPPQQQLDRMLHLGGLLVESGWGNDVERFLGGYGKSGEYRFRPTRWSKDVYPELYDTWDKFVDSVELRFDSKVQTHAALVGNTVAERLGSDSLSEAAFTTALLKWLIVPFGSKPEFCDPVLAAQVPLDSPLQPHLHMELADFYPKASKSAQEHYSQQSVAIGQSIVNAETVPISWDFTTEWLAEQLENEVQLPPRILGGTAHALLVDDPHRTLDYWFRFNVLHEGKDPYRGSLMESIRRQSKLWDVWLPAVNHALDANSQSNPPLRATLATLETQLRARKSEDDWPLQELTEHLTRHLLNRTPEQSHAEVISAGINEHTRDGYWKRTISAASNHDLLNYIILAGGEIPGQLLTPEPLGDDPKLQQLYSAFDAFQTEGGKPGRDEYNEFVDRIEPLEHLLESHPVEAVRILISGMATRIPGDFSVSPRSSLRMLSARGSGFSSPPPIEPLLLLAIFAEMPEADQKVHELVYQHFRSSDDEFTDHLSEAIRSDFSTRDLAIKWLVRLRDRSEHEKLIAKINDLLPFEARKQSPETGDDAGPPEVKESPQTATKPEAAQNIPDSVIEIVVDPSGQITIDKQIVASEKVGDHLASLKADPKTRVNLSVDSELPYSTVATLLDTAKNAGLDDFQLQMLKSDADPQRTRPTPEVPLVQIRVTDEDGKPRPGVTISLRSIDKNAKRLEVEATSGDEILTLDRVLPYGHYYLRAETTDGWSCRIRDVNVEFDRGLQLTLPAPTAGRKAKLSIGAELDFASVPGIKSLPFGDLEMHPQGFSGFFPQSVPDPGKPLGKYKTFPTYGEGIDEIGVRMSITVQRPLKASNGEQLEWSWKPTTDRLSFMLASDGFRQVVDNGYDRIRAPKDEGPFYVSSSSGGDIPKVFYFASKLAEAQTLPYDLTLPAGQATVYLTNIIGRPTDETTKRLLQETTIEAGRELWLPVQLDKDSPWIEQLFQVESTTEDQPAWQPMIGGGLFHLLRQEVSLSPGSDNTIQLQTTAVRPKEAERPAVNE